MYHTAIKMLLVLLFILDSTFTFAKENVEFYIYFNKPPFIIDEEKQTGLSYEFIAALNEYSQKYHYTVSYVPKQRAINFAQDYSGVLWTNPFWVGDPDRIKYDLILDRENYITNDPKFTYQGIESLYGKSIVGVRGFTYFNLEPAFSEKKITRVNVHNEKLIPLMLLSNRADVGVIGFQTYEYFKRTIPEIKDKLYVLNDYKKEFYRSILLDKSKLELKQDIDNWFVSEQGMATWRALQAKWLHNVIDTP